MSVPPVTVFDTSVASENLGDELIMNSVERTLYEVFDNPHLLHIQTHDRIGTSSYDCAKKSSHTVIGGTNLLSSKMGRDQQWDVSPRDFLHINNSILLGVGWRRYQRSPSLYTKILLKRILSSNYLHSVRDSYTKKILDSIGIRNVINTGCPTLWGINEEHCKKIPTSKAENVVFTLTKYNKNKNKDEELLKIIRSEYDKKFFWPQGLGDLDYLRSLTDPSDITIIRPSVRSYSILLSSIDSIDYVGTRLHGGIHSLKNVRRTIIIGIDNRAIEMGNDFCLPVIQRDQPEELYQKICDGLDIKIELPKGNIKKWKRQFSEN